MKKNLLALLTFAGLVLAAPLLQAQSLTVEGDLNVEGDAQIGEAANPGSLLIYGPTGASAGNAVTVQSDGGFVLEGTYGTGTLPSVTPGTAAFMWYPAKAALVVGRDNLGFTHDSLVGNDSIAIGTGTMATANYSTAIGWASEANAARSLALGFGVANESDSVALNAFAYGVDSVGIGGSAAAWGANSIVISAVDNSEVWGDNSIIIGNGIFIDSTYSSAIGNQLYINVYGAAVLGNANSHDFDSLPNQENWDLTHPLLIVGNGRPGTGSSADRSDAMVMRNNGETLFKGFGPNSGSILLKPQDGASYIEVDGNRVLTQGTATHNDTLIVGTGNASSAAGQTLLGRHADASATTAFAIGDGADAANRSNLLSLDSAGSLVLEGELGTGALPGVTPGAAAFMWYPGKAALVAGRDHDGFNDDSVIGNDTVVLGHASRASGNHSIAMGSGANSLANYAISVGDGTVNSAYGIAIGYFGVVSGEYSIALGYGNTGGDLAFAFNSDAIGNESVAIGVESVSNGDQSIAMGVESYATGSQSVSIGNYGDAVGDRSIVMGSGVVTDSFGSIALGIYNDSSTAGTSTSWVATDQLFQVGNGQDDSNRSNALEIKKDGETLLKGYGPNSGSIVLKPQDGASYIEVDGQRVVTQGSGQGEGYLTEGQSDARYVSSDATELGLAGGTATHTDTIVVGTGNTSSAAGQTVVGRYSDATANSSFAVGSGQDDANRVNAFSVSGDGDAVIARDAYVNRNLLVSANTQLAGNVAVNGTLHAQQIYIQPTGGLSMGNYTNGGTPVSTLDPDVEAYVAQVNAIRSAPLDNDAVSKINELAQYLKQQGLWSETYALLLLEEAGIIAHPLGGWTTNSATLSGTGTPSWTSGGGLSFNGSDGYASLTLDGIQSATNLTSFVRIRPSEASAPDTCNLRIFTFGSYDDGRYLTAGLAPSSISGESWSFTTRQGAAQRMLGTSESDFSWSTGEDFVQVLTLSTSGSDLWKGVNSVSLSLSDNATATMDLTPATTGFVSNDNVYIGAAYGTEVLGGKMDGEVLLWMMIKSPLTKVQRESLTAWMEAW
ncbi:MAG: hypothetical protein AAGK14_05140 [Verrucomicrobiota bacterium]